MIDRLRKSLGAVAGIRLFMFAAQDIRAGGRQSDSNYQYTLSSTDLESVAEMGAAGGQAHGDGRGHHRRLQRPRSRRPATDAGDRPQDRGEPRRAGAGHRQRAQQRILAAADLDRLYPAQPVSWWCWRSIRNSRPIRPICERIFVAGANDTQVPLSAVVHYQRDLSPLAVYHTQSFPSTTVSFNMLAGCAARDRDHEHPARGR